MARDYESVVGDCEVLSRGDDIATGDPDKHNVLRERNGLFVEQRTEYSICDRCVISQGRRGDDRGDNIGDRDGLDASGSCYAVASVNVTVLLMVAKEIASM